MDANILRRFKLYINNKRFNRMEFSRFLHKEIGGHFQENRRKAKAIIDEAVKEGHMICLDSKRGVYRMVTKAKVWPPGTINKCNVVGKHVSNLNLVHLDKVNDKTLTQCPHCGYKPKICQLQYLIHTEFGDTIVLICVNCNRVVTEVEDV